MAYEPKTWSCGDVITANDLNHIEQGIAESGGCDCGYECEETRITAFDGSITTEAQDEIFAGTFTPTQEISGDTITVTMDGTEYELPKLDFLGQAMYGEFDISESKPDFTNYPCLVVPAGMFATENPGTYTVKIESINSTITTTSCFGKAVNKVLLLTRFVDGLEEGSVRHINAQLQQGISSFAEGYLADSEGDYSHAEGYATHSDGNSSHAEGQATEADGSYSHAEGFLTKSIGSSSHAEGNTTRASGSGSHAEGYTTTASGSDSHAEGWNTEASGGYSHAEGHDTQASGETSHAEGQGTIANHRSQHVFGENNVADPSTATSSNKGNYIEIVGNGSASNRRSNARTLDWSGNESLQGSLTLGKGTADETTITATQLKALLALLNA